MKTIRLLYPDHLSGGLDTYYFGANLLAHILPQNAGQPLLKVELDPPDGSQPPVTEGIYAKKAVLAGIKKAQDLLASSAPEKVITIGGSCMVSFAPFDYLHNAYANMGVIWIDAHPDVSTPGDGYPNAHAMVLGSLLGGGEPSISSLRKGPAFRPDEILYIGLQGLHDYQAAFLDAAGVDYRVQTEAFLSDDEIRQFTGRFQHIAVHLDIDVLDAALFHSTYFANTGLVGDGSTGGRMTMEELAHVLHCITESADIVGLTIAEYLPFDEEKLHKMLAGISIFKN